MKFNISSPPTGGASREEQLERVLSWLSLLAEKLNVTLSNLGEDNFSDGTLRELLKSKGDE